MASPKAYEMFMAIVAQRADDADLQQFESLPVDGDDDLDFTGATEESV